MTLAPLLLIALASPAWAHEHDNDAESCGDMEVYDYGTAMCQPLAMADMPMSMLMVHGNFFGVQSFQSGPRGRTALAAPNMFMADLGRSVGDTHYFNLDFMGTLEKWTFPQRGYPLLLQVGEHDSSGRPFLDAQHPHSSPIMGLTLSDTISLGADKNHLKVFFAPRGQTTDGPIAFMHRPTSRYNPDAPLGHHIGQDVGHISSTVLGASLEWGPTRLEASAFHGEEPEPTKVDLPLGAPDSFGIRVIQEFTPAAQGMVSFARVNHAEHDDPGAEGINRYSASVYNQHDLGEGWTFANAFIFGEINHYDHTASLVSFTEEFLFKAETPRIWGRVEMLQRTPNELEIPGLNSNDPHWVGAITLGYGHRLTSFGPAELTAGASATADLLPGLYKGAYGTLPFTGRVYLQMGGMGMWEL